MPTRKDITGQRFNLLTAVLRVGRSVHRQSLWHCKCDCGMDVVVDIGSLSTGNTKSCGCIKEYRMPNVAQLGYIFKGMRHRCYNPKRKDFKNYGARGIGICQKWMEDRESFYVWANKNGYKVGLHLDRIDGSSDYSPENCRFVTCTENANNRRNNRFITINGETHTAAGWNRKMGFCYGTVANRLFKGWDETKAVLTPVQTQFSRHRGT